MKYDNKGFRLAQKLKIGESDFNHFMMRFRNQLVIAAVKFGGEQKLSPIKIPKTSKDMEEHLKMSHRVVDVVDRPNTKTCVTMMPYNVDKPDNSYAKVRLISRKKEEIFQQKAYVNCKHDQLE